MTVSPQKYSYMQNRELSWLEFDKRCLDQGADPSVPLLERMNFISIFWSNLQEFFMVRVGSLTDLSLVKKTIVDSKSGMTPAEQLDAIYARCHELYPYYEQTFENLRTLLKGEGVEQLRPDELDDEQRVFLDEYVHDEIMPFLSPQIVNARHPFPHLENGGLYIVVRLDEEAEVKEKKGKKNKKGAKEAGKSAAEKAAAKEAKAAKNLGAEGVTLGLIPQPRQCRRIVRLPGKGLKYVLLEHAIEMYADEIFSMYKIKHTNIICVTRNADLDANEGTDEQDEDYREHMKRILKKRSRLAPVRLESERPLSSTVKKVLLDRLELKEHQTFVSSVPLDMSYTWGLPSLVDAKKRAAIAQQPFTPQWPACLDRNRRIIDQVSEREVLLAYPYESMDPFVQMLREAANDPSVLSIKITLYRLASQSHLAEALIAAAENGKEVTALFELRARFDESNNIEWSQRFEQAGCHVIYGFRDFKVHSKICCITRQTDAGLQHITQLGTGNYNEKTAKLYTDYSFITTDPSIGRDAMLFFRNMGLENTSDEYDIIWVAPLQIKQNILRGIDEQIAKARAGEPSGLFFKTNSVTDKEIIDKIIEASQAGVKCTMLVRGICCLVPGVEGYTDNVRVVSIVGRLLEHSRIYCFGPFDDCRIYLSSADLMTRNMNKRIEIAWPIMRTELRNQVISYIETCLADTAKLRELKPDCTYTPLLAFAKPGETPFNSQDYLIEQAHRRHLEAAQKSAQRDANRQLDETTHLLLSYDIVDDGTEARAAEEVARDAADRQEATYVTALPTQPVQAETAAATAAQDDAATAGAETQAADDAEEKAAAPVENAAAAGASGAVSADDEAASKTQRFAKPRIAKPSPEQIARAQEVAKAAGAGAVKAAKVAGTVAVGVGGIAVDLAKTAGSAAVDAARNANGTTARAAREAARNAAGKTAGESAKAAAAGKVSETGPDTPQTQQATAQQAPQKAELVRRADAPHAKRPGILGRIFGKLAGRK